MRLVIVAIHGILTRQTDPSWPDRLDAWLYRRDPEVKLLKKKYVAGPFPRWNCWVKDPWLARCLAAEIELFLAPNAERRLEPALDRRSPEGTPLEWPSRKPTEVGAPGAASPRQPGLEPSSESSPPIWFVAHSNGAVIALLTMHRLIARGCRIGGLIFTGAACEPDLLKNRLEEWLRRGRLDAAISYSSRDDLVLSGDPRFVAAAGSSRFLNRLRSWLWGKLMWPYGCLGRTGWLRAGKPLDASYSVEQKETERTKEYSVSVPVLTRWYPGGHCGYFKPDQIEATFDQLYWDIINNVEALRPSNREAAVAASHPASAGFQAREGLSTGRDAR